MAEIINVYRQKLPAVKFVGKCYLEEEKENGVFAKQWGEWFEKGWFNPLQVSDRKEPFEDCNAYIGLCRIQEGQPFQYWIGAFLPPDAAVPEGYGAIDFDAGELAVCWVRGKEPDIYFTCCLEKLAEHGFQWKPDKNGVKWCMERYTCPRFTNPDEDGNVILDLCFSL